MIIHLDEALLVLSVQGKQKAKLQMVRNSMGGGCPKYRLNRGETLNLFLRTSCVPEKQT